MGRRMKSADLWRKSFSSHRDACSPLHRGATRPRLTGELGVGSRKGFRRQHVWGANCSGSVFFLKHLSSEVGHRGTERALPGTCWKCKSWGPSPDIQSRKLWERDPSICVNKSSKGACSSLRATDLIQGLETITEPLYTSAILTGKLRVLRPNLTALQGFLRR